MVTRQGPDREAELGVGEARVENRLHLAGRLHLVAAQGRGGGVVDGDARRVALDEVSLAGLLVRVEMRRTPVADDAPQSRPGHKAAEKGKQWPKITNPPQELEVWATHACTFTRPIPFTESAAYLEDSEHVLAVMACISDMSPVELNLMVGFISGSALVSKLK